MSPVHCLNGQETRSYQFGLAEYDREKEKYFINQDGGNEFCIINVEVDDPLASWGEICELVDELKEYGFDHKVDAINIDNCNSIFLRDHYGRLIGIEVSEQDEIEKHIFDAPDIRDLIALPCHIQREDVFF